MSSRLTSVQVAGMNSGDGLADWGRKTHAEMVKQLREYAAHNKAIAEKILAATDDQFIVETYIGVHTRKNIERVMP